MNFKKETTDFKDLYIMRGSCFNDERGLFQRLYCEDAFSEAISDRKIKQVNNSYTIKKGTIRGLHFQKKPFEELKIINCIQGSIFDVVVDLRKDSNTFGKHFSVTLDSKDFNVLVVPEGFAHGFQTLTDDVRIIYFHTAFFSERHQNGINVFSENLLIDWPLSVKSISKRDENLEMFSYSKDYL